MVSLSYDSLQCLILSLILFYNKHTQDTSSSYVVHHVYALLLFLCSEIRVTTTTGFGGTCVSLCVHVCPSFHAGQQRQSWKFVISFLFPLLRSLLHCNALAPLSSIWSSAHAQSALKEFDKTVHAKHFKHKQRHCNSLNSAANTNFSRFRVVCHI